MNERLSRFCINACIFMLLISLSINFVNLLNVFGTNAPSPVQNQSLDNMTKVAGGDILSILGTNLIGLLTGSILAGGGLILVVALAGRTGSWNIVAAYLFGLVFWGSWIGSLSLFSYGGYLSSTPALVALMGMITLVMIFIFAGATLGILGGNE